MSGKFIDILYSIVIQFRWKFIAFYFVLFFLGSWWAAYYFEPGADITSPSVYWWYFLTNVIRGGYSGYAPDTLGGRIVSIFSFFGGGVFFLATICKLTAGTYAYTQRSKKGLSILKMENHIVLLGYRKGESEGLILQLQHDRPQKRIVLCTRHLDENPMPGIIDFVKGDTASDDVLLRSCADKADVIVINGHTDERAMAVSIAANDISKSTAHIVVYIEDSGNARFIRKINHKIECVSSMRTMMLAQAVINPGSACVIRELVSLEDPGTCFRINIPLNVPEVPFHQMLAVLHHEYQAIAIALTESHLKDAKHHLNPSSDTMVKGGMSLFYIAEHRIDDVINWSIFSDENLVRGIAAVEEHAPTA